MAVGHGLVRVGKDGVDFQRFFELFYGAAEVLAGKFAHTPFEEAFFVLFRHGGSFSFSR